MNELKEFCSIFKDTCKENWKTMHVFDKILLFIMWAWMMLIVFVGVSEGADNFLSKFANWPCVFGMFIILCGLFKLYAESHVILWRYYNWKERRRKKYGRDKSCD